MNKKDKNRYLQSGLEYLRQGGFFETHEEWEIPWQEMSGDIRSFWQAMIQLSVGAHHFRNGNKNGCRNLWKKALKRCDDILEKNQVQNRNCVFRLQEILQTALQKAMEGEDPLRYIRRFASDVVTEDWFEFE
jgi:predicted metal-dependent hydrolase